MALTPTGVNTNRDDKRFRIQVRFHLDVNKPFELDLLEWLDTLKQQRLFTKVIRDALRLYRDLSNGNLDVLRELFPHAVTLQSVATTTTQTAPEASHEASPAPLSRPTTSSDTKSLDDIQLDIKRTGNTTDNNASYNFMLASALQVYDNYDALPPDIIDYGVRTGRIPPDKVPQKSKPKPTQKQNEIGQIAGSNVAFDVPDFDDIDLGVLQ